mmetsp:Transcript_88789/g.256072  ORF Transcript_88789/g.256072 Transcript_88789/m.256072 type:complete len:99 (+) Transcript_88789:431-727(+)
MGHFLEGCHFQDEDGCLVFCGIFFQMMLTGKFQFELDPDFAAPIFLESVLLTDPLQMFLQGGNLSTSFVESLLQLIQFGVMKVLWLRGGQGTLLFHLI